MHRKLTELQALTIAGALGVTMLNIYTRIIPAHKRNARKMAAVEKAVAALYAGQGDAIDEETAVWILDCWNKTMRETDGNGSL